MRAGTALLRALPWFGTFPEKVVFIQARKTQFAINRKLCSFSWSFGQKRGTTPKRMAVFASHTTLATWSLCA